MLFLYMHKWANKNMNIKNKEREKTIHFYTRIRSVKMIQTSPNFTTTKKCEKRVRSKDERDVISIFD